jgi:hypothetical protein
MMGADWDAAEITAPAVSAGVSFPALLAGLKRALYPVRIVLSASRSPMMKSKNAAMRGVRRKSG